MSHTAEAKEQERVALQASLDAKKTQAERNRLGQFATPTALAEDILRYAGALLPPATKVRFLDPAIGTGSFYSALLRVFLVGDQSRPRAVGGHHCLVARRLYAG